MSGRLCAREVAKSYILICKQRERERERERETETETERHRDRDTASETSKLTPRDKLPPTRPRPHLLQQGHTS